MDHYLVFYARARATETFAGEMIFCVISYRIGCCCFVSSSYVMSYLKKLLVCAVGMVLVWCGGSSSSDGTEQSTHVDRYLFSLPQGYVSVSPALVENKQLVNKVIASYKLPAETKGTFEPNIIVTRSDLPAEINFEQFWTLNAQKMVTELAGYIPWTKEVVSFSCGEENVQALLVFFRLKDPWYKAAPEVRMAQYQFVHHQKWYIVSAAYLTEDDQQWFRDVIETWWCTEPVGSEWTWVDSVG